MDKTVPMWIDGNNLECDSMRRGNIHAPATGEVIRTVAFADELHVHRAVSAAEAAFPAWRDTTALNRARVLNRFRDLLQKNHEPLVRLVSEEHGKTVSDAMGSVQRGIEVVEFA